MYKTRYVYFGLSMLFILGVSVITLRKVNALGDVWVDYDFSNTGDYTTSSDTYVEISGNSVHLKVLTYSTDPSTKLLFHLDENTGSSVTDASGNSNTGTLNDHNWITGKLNQGIGFTGPNSKLSVEDSPAVSLTGTNTLEGWVKFDETFDATTRGTKQTIYDKGDYQLYFDNETGKITYELSSTSANTWTQRAGNDVNGSWDLNGKTNVDSMTKIGTNVYVGLGTVTGDAEVWKLVGTTWTMVGGDGINNSWGANTFESVTSLETDGTNLYAGIGLTAGDGEVWKYTVATNDWAKIGGDGVASSWAVNTIESVYSLEYFGGNLYAGLGLTQGDGDLWRYNGTSWAQIGGDGLNSGWATNTFEYVQSLESDGTYLYAGLGATAGDAEVWRWNGTAWTRIGGDAVNTSWANSLYEYVWSLKAFGGNLYAGIGLTQGEAEVWRWNGTAWAQIGGDAINTSWALNTYESVYSLETDGTNLYAGLGLTAGDSEVWRYNGTAWTKIGGDSVNSGYAGNLHTIIRAMTYAGTTLYIGNISGNAARSGEVWGWNGTTWSRLGGNYANTSWGFSGFRAVETMAQSGEYLYAGMGNTDAGDAMVLRYDNAQWIPMGGQALNSSWAADTYEAVMSSASYKGNFYVGLGISTGEAEVWKWNGTAWSQIGGDALNSSWPINTYEEVTTLASDDEYLYAGLGSGINDAEVWRYNGTVWSKIGGDSANSGWTTNYDRVVSTTIYNGKLVVGLGSSAGEAEVWQWSGTAWSKIGGDTVASSWDAVNFEQVDTLLAFNNKLYAGLGTGTGDAEVWEYNGTTWTKIGGDDVNSGWTSGTYERIRALAGFNGKLYAGTGNGTNEGEVWIWDGTNWEQTGGDSLNSSWTNIVEEVVSMAVYKGKLYTGLGNTQNADAAIWSTGNNALAQSSTNNFDTNWHHIAATYDGSAMKIYIDGVEDSSTTASVTIPDSTNRLLIGTGYSGRESSRGIATLQGSLDELRISNTARTSFNTTPYSNAEQTVSNATAAFTQDIASYSDFAATEDVSSGGTIKYRISDNNGTNWKYWNGSQWATSNSTSDANTEADINDNIDTFPVTSLGIKWQAIMQGNGNQQLSISAVRVDATSDTQDPNPPSSFTFLNQAGGGTTLASNTWYPYATPYFEWVAPTDNGAAGVAGYFVYFGTTNSATPSTAGTFQTGTTYSPTPGSLVSGQTYYLRIQTKDRAQNLSPIYSSFSYRYDASVPNNPSTVTVTPSGYASTNSFTFTWPSIGDGIATDVGSQIAGYQYKTGASTGPFSDWSITTTDTTITLPDAAYQTDANIFYLRTVDNAGNISATNLQTTYYFAGEGPGAPQFLTVTPSTNTANSFAFSWQAPSSHLGDASDLTYCYTINTLPTPSSCTFTSAGATTLSASSFATQVGINTFYLVAKNPDDLGGAINYGVYSSVSFTANTSAPGVPLGLEISDVSIKSSLSWRLALSWSTPTSTGSGIASYQIHRSEDGTTYTYLASTSGAAYIDTGLDQKTYYYKVTACDNVNNCGIATTPVSLLPTGKFTDAAVIVDTPVVTDITTKKAVVTWTTDRASDSKVSYGEGSGDYFDEEPSNSVQAVSHTINLTNLTPGVTYTGVAKWTDEDGNTGLSDEFEFSTLPAPTVTDPQVKTLGIDNVVLQYTVSGASKTKIYYGKTSAFGGSIELATSSAETTYNATLDQLEDGTKYFYKINTFDTESAEYEGSILSFETLPRPKIADLKIQQVKGSAQPAALITWTTNTEVSSIVTYYPQSNPAQVKDEVDVKLIAGEHKMLIRGLLPETPYTIIIKGRDKAGNEAQSDPNTITTATDTRSPSINDLLVESSIIPKSGDSQTATAQIVVTWNTDETASTQVEYGEGTGTTYSQKTQEDTNLTFNHLAVISGLSPSKVYHLRVITKDKAGNETKSIDTVTITPKATDNALDLVIANLGEAFTFLK